MTNKKISNFEFATLNFFITRAFLISVIFNILISSMKQDSWIIPLISLLPAIIFILLINYIMNYETKLNLPQKIIQLFNNFYGKVIIFIITIFAFLICILNYLNLTNFIQSQFLSKTPLLAISILFIITAFYILTKELNVISRTGNILFYISIVLCIVSFLGLLPSFKINNLKPFLISSPENYITSLNSYYTFNIIPIIMLTIIPKDRINNPKIKLSLIISYILSAITIFAIMFQTLSIFGYELTMLYEYPEFLVLKHFSFLGLSSRIESILIMQLLFDIFIFNIFIIYFISINITVIFNIKKNNLKNIIYFTVCILLVVFTVYASKYNIYIDNFIKNSYFSVITIIITLIILLIVIKIKASK